MRNVLTLHSCAPIVGAEVMSFDNEAALLKVPHFPSSRQPLSPLADCPSVGVLFRRPPVSQYLFTGDEPPPAERQA